MFSEKYKDCLVSKLFKSMKQLDRIEFQNRLIQQNQSIILANISRSVFTVINFISICFLIYFSAVFTHLLSLGFYSDIHKQSGLFFILILGLGLLCSVVTYIARCSMEEKFKKLNDEQLDLILDK